MRSWPGDEAGTTSRTIPVCGPGTGPAQVITRRLAASGVGVHGCGRGDNCELVILNVPGARSCLTLTGTGHARWHYEPPHGAATSAATLTEIILHILSAPHTDSDPGADGYRAFPLKGIVGRCLQDPSETLTAQLEVLDELPELAGLDELPERLQTELFTAFDIQILWNAPMKQATFFATIPTPPPASWPPCWTARAMTPPPPAPPADQTRPPPAPIRFRFLHVARYCGELPPSSAPGRGRET